MELFSIFVLVLLCFVVLLVFLGVKSVPQGREYTVERFGRYTRTLQARPQPHHPVRRPHRRAR